MPFACTCLSDSVVLLGGVEGSRVCCGFSGGVTCPGLVGIGESIEGPAGVFSGVILSILMP